jgi:RNA polymerase sigma factor (sigma-70 family)
MTSPQPFEDLVAEHGPSVMRVCRALLGGGGEADDAWSETFLAAMRAYPRLRPGSNLQGWLVTIAHHKAIDLIRARSRRALPTGDPPEAVATDQAPPEPDEDLRAALDALPTKQRAAVIYRYLADLSYAEIGELLECSEAAARRNASDGIAKLRQRYQKGMPT